MTLINRKTLTFTDIVEFLSVHGSGVPSPLGSILDKLRDGVYFITNTGVNNEEYKTLAKSDIIDCIDKLRLVNKIDFEIVDDLRAFARTIKVGEGPLCLAVIASYHEWSSRSEQRGLVEVYRLMQKLDPSLPEPNHREEDSLVQAFRTGREKKARNKAAKLLADAELTLYTWVQICNKRNKRKNIGE